MKKSELVLTLFALKEDQLKGLKRFAESDLVNRGSRRLHVSGLLKYLMKHFPKAESDDISQANVWKSLFGKREFDRTELSKIASDTLLVLKEFIIREEHSQTGEIDRMLLLARFYLRKDLDKYFKYTTDEIRKKIKISQLPDRWLHFEVFQLEDLQSERESKYYTRKEDSSLASGFENLELFYLLSKLRFCCGLAIHNQVSSVTDSVASNWLIPDEELLKKYLHMPSVDIWITAFRMFNSDGEIEFQRLDSLLDENKKNLPFEDLSELASYLRLYCNRKYLQFGDRHFLDRLFSLQTKHLRVGYLQPINGKIAQNTILNLTSAGIKLKRHEEVKAALKTVGQNIIGADQPEKTLALNQALLAFATGQVKEALKLIPSHDFEDVQYQIVCRVLWMKIWYETEEFDRLESEINTFRVYVHRACEEKKIITPARKEVNFAFIRFLSSLYKLKFIRSQEQVLEKITELNEKKTVADREWLLEKFECLLKR